MSIIKDHFNKHPPETLYHYTDMKGALGILKNGVIWATVIQYLNDSTEFSHFLELIETEIKKKKPASKKTLKDLQDAITTIRDVNIAVSCFSRDSDSLSQWRAYGRGESGFAIGFDSKKLSQLGNSHLVLRECIYNEGVQIEMAREIIGDLLTGRVKEPADIIFNLLSIAPLMKNEHFSDEKEWRLYTEYPVSASMLDSREGRSMIIPYFELPLYGVLGADNIVTKVVVGPTPNMRLSKTSMEKLLLKVQNHKEGYGFARPSVRNSKIPYRDW